MLYDGANRRSTRLAGRVGAYISSGGEVDLLIEQLLIVECVPPGEEGHEADSAAAPVGSAAGAGGGVLNIMNVVKKKVMDVVVVYLLYEMS